ncbi:hypothetical protein Agub_g1459, partial [Astrephomene gubernaculifera]
PNGRGLADSTDSAMQTSRSSLRLSIWLSDEDVAAKSAAIRLSKSLNRHISRLRLAPQWLMVDRKARFASVLLLFLAALLALGVLLQAVNGLRSEAHADKYAVYIDGGSSGTRVRVFRYRPARAPAYVALVLPEPSMAVEPGLSAHAGHPRLAAASLQPLLDFAYEHVPPQRWSVTPVRLLATAGLRLLSEQQQVDILAACRELLAASRLCFKPEWATVIGGEMEGLYGWAAVNYITGALQEAAGHAHHSRKEVLDPAQLFTGLLEMGGASMQVTFLPPAAVRLPEQYGKHLHLPGVPSRLFTHSYLGLGMDSALARAAEYVLQRQRQQQQHLGPGERHPRVSTVADPCLPVGYVSEDGRHGNASFLQCLEVVNEILPAHNCSTGAVPGAADDDGRTHHHHHSQPASSTAGSSTHITEGDDGDSIGHSGHRSTQSIGASSSSGTGSGSSGCFLQGSYVPALAGRFVAVENFAWTARALGLPTSATLRQLREHGGQYCARHWSSLHAEFSGHISDQFLVRYCFGAAYILALLHRGLGLGLDDTRLTWTNTVRERSSGAEVGLNWVLGAAVVDAMSDRDGPGGIAGAEEGGGSGSGGRGGSQRFRVRADSGDPTASVAGMRRELLLPLVALFVLVGFLAVVLLRVGAGQSRKAPAAAQGNGGSSSAGRTAALAAPGRQMYGTGGGLGATATAWSTSSLATAVAAPRYGPTAVAVEPSDAGSLDPGLGPRPAAVEGRGDGRGPTGGGQGAVRNNVGHGGLQTQEGGGGGSRHAVVVKSAGSYGANLRRSPSFVSVWLGLDSGPAR